MRMRGRNLNLSLGLGLGLGDRIEVKELEGETVGVCVYACVGVYVS